MHPYFEDAALLLHLITRHGLDIKPAIDHRALIDTIARHLDRSLAQSVSHADAALAVLKELERDGAAICLPAQRTKVLAVIGTTIGNRIPRRRTSRR